MKIHKYRYTKKLNSIPMCFSLLALWFPDSFCNIFSEFSLAHSEEWWKLFCKKEKCKNLTPNVFPTHQFIVVRRYCARTVFFFFFVYAHMNIYNGNFVIYIRVLLSYLSYCYGDTDRNHMRVYKCTKHAMASLINDALWETRSTVVHKKTTTWK